MNQTQALDILKSGANVFLTGEPGSGKTYTINRYVAYLRSHGIEPAITASTGIAATHIGGMTIHSWSGIGIRDKFGRGDLSGIASSSHIKKRVGSAKILIIDEISMLPPMTLQMVDAVCREVKNNNLPFGGIQIVLVGDFFQLPPVVRKNYTLNSDAQEGLFDETPLRFAYDAPCWHEADFTTCYITQQYRQDDSDFLSLLGKIRQNCFDDLSLDIIKRRKIDPVDAPENAPKLYSHNIDVDTVNDKMLAKIPGEARFFPMKTKGREVLVAAMKKGCLSPEALYLKIGAAVMFTKNNQKAGFVNGTLGTVISFDEETDQPIVRIRNGRDVLVEESDWIVEEDGKERGKLTQLPLRLAWAITVHKSQGVSLDEAVMDLSRVFEYGQGYVALSRVRRLAGIYLLGWNDKAFQVDPQILQQDEKMRFFSDQAERIFSGFSDEDLTKLQHDFILACGGAVDLAEVTLLKKKAKSPTAEVTYEYFKQNMTIGEIAKVRKISEKTVIGHIEDLAKRGKMKEEELLRVLSDKARADLRLIQKAFKDLKTEMLTPIFEHFQGRYSYDDLRFARRLIKK